MASRDHESHSPSERSCSSHGYRSSRLSPRRRSRSPLRPPLSSPHSRRRSLSRGPRENESYSSSGRHNPGATKPLPSEMDQKKIQITVRNPMADMNPTHNGSVNLHVRDVQIPRRMAWRYEAVWIYTALKERELKVIPRCRSQKSRAQLFMAAFLAAVIWAPSLLRGMFPGEGSAPIFEFLGNMSAPSRRVILVNQTSEVKQEPSSHSCRSHERNHNVMETRDSRVSPRRHSTSSDRYPQSRSIDPGHSRSGWERERDHDLDRGNPRDSARDFRRGDSQDFLKRRGDREHDRSYGRTRDRERVREFDRDRYHEKERDRSETKDSNKEQENQERKESDQEQVQVKAEPNVEQVEPSSERAVVPYTRPQVPHMNRGMPRQRGPRYPHPMGHPPFLPRGHMPPMGFMPPGPMFGPPPPFIAQRMMGPPRPRF